MYLPNVLNLLAKWFCQSNSQTGCDANGTRSELIRKNNRLFFTLYLSIFSRWFRLLFTTSIRRSSLYEASLNVELASLGIEVFIHGYPIFMSLSLTLFLSYIVLITKFHNQFYIHLISDLIYNSLPSLFNNIAGCNQMLTYSTNFGGFSLTASIMFSLAPHFAGKNIDYYAIFNSLSFQLDSMERLILVGLEEIYHFQRLFANIHSFVFHQRLRAIILY